MLGEGSVRYEGWRVTAASGVSVFFVSLLVYTLPIFLSAASGTIAAVLLGMGIGGESDVVPYLVSRYFGLRSFATLYGLTWIATAGAAAAGPILMGWTFDATGSYEALLSRFSFVTLSVALLMLMLPRYREARIEPPVPV